MQVRWEPLDVNRRLTLQSATEVRVISDWGQPSSTLTQPRADSLSLAPRAHDYSCDVNPEKGRRACKPPRFDVHQMQLFCTPLGRS